MRVRVVGVKRYRDRHGKWRAYYRRKGAPSVAIDPDLKGTALAAEVHRLDQLYLAPKAKTGTLRSLIGEYKAQSNHWRGLRPRTRDDYERVFKWLGKGADAALVDITAPEVARVRDVARDAHEPKFANQVVTTLKKVLAYGKERGIVPENAAAGLEKATGGRKRPNRPLEPWEVVNLFKEAPKEFLPVLALAIYGGVRRGDLAAFPKPRDGKTDWLGFVQGKTKRPHEVALVPDLREVLADIPEHEATTLLVSSKLTPWSEEGIDTAWDRLRGRLLARGMIGAGARFHGMRHTGATWLEEAGYEEAQTKHFLGHGPRTVSGHYGQSANRRKLVWDMALVIQNVIREARGNVVRIGNRND